MGKTTIVIDNGSRFCKAGFAGETTPKSIFRSVVSLSATQSSTAGGARKAEYVGDKAFNKRDTLSLTYPIQNGVVQDQDWDAMETVWRHAIKDELKRDPTEQPILITEHPTNPKAKRERMTQIVFEGLNAPAFYTNDRCTLALYAAKCTTGMSVHVGETVTYIVPIYEGYKLPHSIMCQAMGNADLTAYFKKMLVEEKGYKFTSDTDRDGLTSMRELLCYVASDYDHELQKVRQGSSLQESYKLPDGRSITVASERFRAPELLFQPEILGRNESGIHHSTFHGVMKCDVDVRKSLYENIVLCGGGTIYSGFKDRLQKEITALAPSSINVKVSAPDNRYISSWVGGSVLASQSTFKDMWITKKEYEEEGASIVHRKCI